MPGYSLLGNITALYQGDSINFWASEAVVVGSSSVQAALAPSIGSEGQAASVEIAFSADPGAFQIDVQTSDTDNDIDYVTETSITGGMNSHFVCRTEISNPFVAKFWRLNLVALTNGVTISAKGTKG